MVNVPARFRLSEQEATDGKPKFAGLEQALKDLGQAVARETRARLAAVERK